MKKRCLSVQCGPPGSVTCLPPVFVSQPQAQAIVIGGTANFSGTVTGTAPISYQWFKDSVAISGQTARTLTIANVSNGDVGNYTLQATNTCGNQTSNPAALSIAIAITGYWVAMDTDPFPTINGGSDPYSYPNSVVITHNAPIPFALATIDQNRYFVFKVPVGESVKTGFTGAPEFPLLNGAIPGPAFHTPIVIGSFRYYIPSDTFAYNAGTVLKLI